MVLKEQYRTAKRACHIFATINAEHYCTAGIVNYLLKALAQLLKLLDSRYICMANKSVWRNENPCLILQHFISLDLGFLSLQPRMAKVIFTRC